MSFEEYVEHIKNKSKLSIAIAIIRKKPVNLSIEQYIATLKQKLDKNSTDPNLLEVFNENFDDFDELNDDDFNINDDESLFTEFNTSFVVGETQVRNNATDTENLDNASLNLLNDFNDPILSTGADEIATADDVSKSTKDGNSFDDILMTLQDIDEEHQPKNNVIVINTQITTKNHRKCDAIEDDYNNKTNHINLVNINDTQTTIDERIRENVEKNITKLVRNVKPIEIDDYMIENNDLFKDDCPMDVDLELNNNQDDSSQIYSINTNVFKEKTAIISKNIAKELNKLNQNTHIENNTAKDINAIDTQATLNYTLPEWTQNYTHISQSQFNNVEISEQLIYGNRNEKILEKHQQNYSTLDKNFRKIEYINNKASDFKHINDSFKDINKHSDINLNTASNDKHNNIEDINNKDLDMNTENQMADQVSAIYPNNIQYIIDNTGRTYKVLNSFPISKNSFRTDDDENLELDNFGEHSGKSKDLNLHIDKEVIEIAKEATANEKESHFDEDFNTEMQANELIPFKVVKELSRVKAYLDRKDRTNTIDSSSSDSGYRSDSQGLKIARTPDEWLYQSGHCLYQYLVQSPLVSAAQEFNVDVSQVLGRLIDRLYEEERQPLFLEEMLSKIESLLLNLLTHGQGDSILLEKDETIQRLLLLNKSTHLLKFSLEKISNQLLKIHTTLVTEENLYELTSIEEVENLRYLFYILEIFIQNFLKVKDIFSQSSSQGTQEKVLKKCSITEIWRKKWNPELKEIKNVGSQDKSCVLVKCGDVLNKIIVDCMEGYSLVAFAALQCFNLLQS